MESSGWRGRTARSHVPNSCVHGRSLQYCGWSQHRPPSASSQALLTHRYPRDRGPGAAHRPACLLADSVTGPQRGSPDRHDLALPGRIPGQPALPLLHRGDSTDTSHDGLPAPAADLVYLRVPASYRTPGGTRNKARALEYALHHSKLPDDAWIVHLDEETQPTPSGIRGIARMIAEEEHLGRPRIGQGTIVYHRDWEDHPFFTLSDCIRTGSDLGRLYLSMRAGIPLFGLHGSYIVVRNDVEKQVGFDVGEVGSITEDQGSWAASRCRRDAGAGWWTATWRSSALGR